MPCMHATNDALGISRYSDNAHLREIISCCTSTDVKREQLIKKENIEKFLPYNVTNTSFSRVCLFQKC